MTEIVLLSVLIFLAATLYGSVGHAGASAYLAAMALVGVAPAVMKPAALVLNILAATIVTIQFYRAGCFSWALLWPFAAGSIPMSFVGGAITLPTGIYKPIVGALLILAALRMMQTAARLATQPKALADVSSSGHIGVVDPPMPDSRAPESGVLRPPPIAVALICGGAIGVISGLTGTGGGILLSPLILLMGWATTRSTSGVSAAFILCNSISGLAGNLLSIRALPPAIAGWAIASAAGAAIGSQLGSRHLAPRTLRYLLSLVLIVAGCKLIFV